MLKIALARDKWIDVFVHAKKNTCITVQRAERSLNIFRIKHHKVLEIWFITKFLWQTETEVITIPYQYSLHQS